jgi:hypothetical protein
MSGGRNVLVEPRAMGYHAARVIDVHGRPIGGLADYVDLADMTSRCHAARWLARTGACSFREARRALEIAWFNSAYERRAP